MVTIIVDVDRIKLYIFRMNISQLLSEEDYEYMERFYFMNITSCNTSQVTRDERVSSSMDESICSVEHITVILHMSRYIV